MRSRITVGAAVAALVLSAATAVAQTPAGAPAPAPASAAPRASAGPDSLNVARKYTQWFYTNQVDSLIAVHPEADRARPELRAQLEQRMATLASRAGTELEVVEEKFVRRNGLPQYWRTAKFSNYAAEPILFRLVIVDGQIRGMGLGPLSQAPPIDP